MQIPLYLKAEIYSHLSICECMLIVQVEGLELNGNNRDGGKNTLQRGWRVAWLLWEWGRFKVRLYRVNDI